MHSRRSIFIGGCGRSGTTMLGSALGAAPEAVVTPESQFKLKLIHQEKAVLLPENSEAIYAQIASDERFQVLWEMTVSPHVSCIEDEKTDTYVRRILFDIVDQYAQRHNRQGWEVWIDHSPNNIENVPSLMTAFPDSKFIHLVRDGRAAMASVLPLDWGPADPIQAAYWWMRAVACGLAAERRYPKQVLFVKYESLTQNPEAELRRICEFTGLTYTEEMLTANALRKSRYIEQQHVRVGTTISPDTNDLWRRSLSIKEISLFEMVCGSLLELLDYPLENTDTSGRFSRIDLMFVRLKSAIKKAKKRRRLRQRVADSLQHRGVSQHGRQ
ncbi:MAG: sulfotransferase [Parvibaculum sp.]|uniref:sulfotransferase family protein n=1 Tax=Parvibaculum sp. TaxID=2024848 RepID=UPI002ABB81E9|nr:sulfotransferase [Parvibaculum sp.]MDZ4379865.1 sulfotransferase [Parvibaculum sp.]